MSLRLYGVVIDSKDPSALAHWWADALGWQVVFEAADEVAVARDEQTHPGLVFVPVPESRRSRTACIWTSLRMTVTRRWRASRRWGHGGSTSVRVPSTPGWSSPIRRATSSASCALATAACSWPPTARAGPPSAACRLCDQWSASRERSRGPRTTRSCRRSRWSDQRVPCLRRRGSPPTRALPSRPHA